MDYVGYLLGFDSSVPIADVYGCNGQGEIFSFQA
jgi:hypothetical protein